MDQLKLWMHGEHPQQVFDALRSGWKKARYYPEDAEYLLELEEKVTHYEVMFSASSMES